MILLELFRETPTKYQRVEIHLINDGDVEFEEACRRLGEWKAESRRNVGWVKFIYLKSIPFEKSAIACWPHC